MKASDKPEISKKWWTSEKPADIKGADLEKALANCEKALAAADKKNCDADTIKAALASLESLSDAVEKTIKKECDKKKHKDLITVLEKFDDLIDDRAKELDKSQDSLEDAEADEDEDEKGVFKEEYRGRMIKLLRGGQELNFCLGLNKQAPEDSKIVLCNKRKPERLHKMLKQTGDFTNRLMTFGTATGDGKMLQLRLSDDAKEPSQIVKVTKKFLKGHRDLKYKKIRVLAGGNTFEEDVEAEGEGQAAAGGGQAATPMEDLRRQFKLARKKWVAVRDKAEQDLEVVKDGVRDHYINDIEQFPIAVNKLKELDDIMNNLNDDLRNALDAYVSTPLNQQAKLHELGTSARQIVESFADYVDKSPLLTAIDQKEFADVQIKAPMSDALKELAKTIS